MFSGFSGSFETAFAGTGSCPFCFVHVCCDISCLYDCLAVHMDMYVSGGGGVGIAFRYVLHMFMIEREFFHYENCIVQG